jgi:hypothetical protein
MSGIYASALDRLVSTGPALKARRFIELPLIARR